MTSEREEHILDLLTATREDVADIKARIESLPDHETRLRSLERFRYGVPGSAFLALLVSAIALIVPHT